jgi:phosphoenolpyruvate-protein kinase (PTS system EI component)
VESDTAALPHISDDDVARANAILSAAKKQAEERAAHKTVGDVITDTRALADNVVHGRPIDIRDALHKVLDLVEVFAQRVMDVPMDEVRPPKAGTAV